MNNDAKFRFGEVVFIDGTEEGPFEVTGINYGSEEVFYNLSHLEKQEVQFSVCEDDLKEQADFLRDKFKRKREERKNKRYKLLAPCECRDWNMARKLNEQGIGHNEYSLEISPIVVILSTNDATLKIPMRQFERFARWFLESQEVEDDERLREESKKELDSYPEWLNHTSTFHGDN